MAGEYRGSEGTTIAFGTSGFEASMKWETFEFGGVSREAIPTPHLNVSDPGSNKFGNVDKILSKLVDAGEFSCDISWDPNADLNDILHGDLEEITITFVQITGESTAASMTFTGGVVGWSASGAIRDKNSANITIAISGDVAITAAT